MKPDENKPQDPAAEQAQSAPPSEQQIGQAQAEQTEQQTEQPADLAAQEPPPAKSKGKGTKKAAAPEEDSLEGQLRTIGLAAIAEHGLKAAFVTADGQVFTLRCDAAAHAENIQDKTIEHVKV